MIIRKAKKKDVPIIWKLTRELAEYEEYLHECTITKQAIAKMFFGKKACVECYLIEDEGKIIGMGKLLTVMETYSGVPFFMLRDFIVQEKYRGKKYGKQFLEFVAALAHKRGYSGVQWNVLDWNKPAIAFYRKMGATISKTVRMQIESTHFQNRKTVRLSALGSNKKSQ